MKAGEGLLTHPRVNIAVVSSGPPPPDALDTCLPHPKRCGCSRSANPERVRAELSRWKTCPMEGSSEDGFELKLAQACTVVMYK